MTSGYEQARHWVDPALPGVDLLQARYVEKRFVRHTHESFVIGAITEGVEAFEVPGGLQRVGAGGLALVDPDTVHTGHAGVPEGWTYSVLYPSVEVVGRIAADMSALRGTPRFSTSAVHDPAAAQLVARVHRALDEGNALAADSLFRLAVAQVLRRHGRPMPARSRADGGAAVARRARAVLEEDLLRPPTLDKLAAGLGVSPFTLLRAFRKEYGMPPHTWLTDARVRRARRLLDGGVPPARAAADVGFTDQAHLSRHFSRIVGVPPGAYRRERMR
ncbi:AraC family transcriptional regulator [Streptomyces sp. NPDC051940]|uniref:AraC family transcriptional regulator n=1 Tax=Streptomyces sp. NPDC051940 TaxID=3155675 RepID=UPI00342FF4A3